MPKRISAATALVGTVLLTAACGDSTGVGIGDSVSVNFRVAAGGPVQVVLPHVFGEPLRRKKKKPTRRDTVSGKS